MTLSQTPSISNRSGGKPEKLRGIFLLDEDAFRLIYAGEHYNKICQLVDIIAPPQTRDDIRLNPGILKNIDVIFSGWGMPVVDHSLLSHAPHLQAIFYGAGAIGYFATQHMWDRKITVTSSIHANSVPVAEYSLATILFSLKQGWQLARATRENKMFVDRNVAPGAYGSTVGIISLGEVARLLLKLLKPFDLNIVAYDPYVSDEDARKLGVQRVSLTELFKICDVVSIHTPLFPETQNMISGKLINSMKQGATLINTSRGGIINQPEMLDVLAQRRDLQAVLDVCEPEPPPADSALFTLPNILLTPHIAGSVGQECKRMGQYMVDELGRYIRDEPLKYQIRPENTDHSSNRPLKTFIDPGLKSTAILESI